MNTKRLFLSLVVVVTISLTGCRGWRTEAPPFHPNPNLDWQPKFKAQTLSLTPPEGTVAWGRGNIQQNQTRDLFIKTKTAFYLGKDSAGNFVTHFPVEVNSALVLRGQQRFNIYCAPCHDMAGSGKGMVVQRGFLPPTDLRTESRVIAYVNGQLFDIISNGIRNMPSYAKQIPEEDRWAIVSYLRALQKTQNATLRDVPESSRSSIQE